MRDRGCGPGRDSKGLVHVVFLSECNNIDGHKVEGGIFFLCVLLCVTLHNFFWLRFERDPIKFI